MTFREEEKMIFKGSNYIIKYYNFFFFQINLYCYFYIVNLSFSTEKKKK